MNLYSQGLTGLNNRLILGLGESQELLEVMHPHNPSPPKRTLLILGGSPPPPGVKLPSKSIEVMFVCVHAVQSIVAAIEVDPDEKRTGLELITSKGYPLETHNVTTLDGYVLQVFRIPHGRKNYTSHGYPVILQHGLIDSSDTWILNLANESLAFLLADKGYDVWLGNSRGNKYSLGHNNTDLHDYWDFSWDDMAAKDIPALIRYVQGMTGYSKLAYIGHSQGTTQMFANLATDKSVAKDLSIFIAMAPVTYIYNTDSEILELASQLGIDKLVHFFHGGSFLPTSKSLKEFLPYVCGLSSELCKYITETISGYEKSLNTTRWPVYVSHFPSGTSTKDMVKWAQGIRHDAFAMYDYGYFGNLENYGQLSAPVYNLSKATEVPFAVLSGEYDKMGDAKDVQRLLELLPAGSVRMKKCYSELSHMDFTWSPYIVNTVYRDAIELLQDIRMQDESRG
eukprot:NODE_557_length_1616_cov_92.056796_g459_i0.p1 GENE.NODE_557_length_1616_cov_92.056796_g459_i0~~NODE_557_length_1616_cov_92.056796_g459_i0.p1  ORF type:complete len:453 (+),score=90.43 NODE_557_length_1616_cov_92.056796_g459_i0:155-1513(+)